MCQRNDELRLNESRSRQDSVHLNTVTAVKTYPGMRDDMLGAAHREQMARRGTGSEPEQLYSSHENERQL